MVRTWVRALCAALLTAAVVGAGELGLAYGLGILRWQQSFDAGGDNGWSAHLTWAAFIGALAVVGGAVGGVRSLRRAGVRDGLGSWLAVSLAAVVGAAVTVPLVVHPAESAQVDAALNPPLQAGLTTAVGIAVGLFAALAVLCARPVAASVLVLVLWAWLLAVVSVYAQLGPQTVPDGVRLGVLDVPSLGRFGDRYAIYLMVGTAVLAGAAIAGYARWLGEHPVAVAGSGLAGPALLAAAYLIAGRGVSGDHTDQRNPYLAAVLAAAAGLGASVLVAVVSRRQPRSEDSGGPVEPPPEPDDSQAAPPPRPAARPPAQPVAHEEDYVSWVSQLGDGENDDDWLSTGSRRRLRSGGEPDDPTEHIPHPRSPQLGRPYVSPLRRD